MVLAKGTWFFAGFLNQTLKTSLGLTGAFKNICLGFKE
jgi:hypothetical protein